MEIRDNVRRRRRERIVQLIGQRPAGENGTGDPNAADSPAAIGSTDMAERPRKTNIQELFPHTDTSEPSRHGQEDILFPPIPERTAQPQPHAEVHDLDPEKWWKEQQKRRDQAGPSWRGVGGLSPTSMPPRSSGSDKTYLSRLASGFAVRLAAAAVLFGGAWVWFHSDLPGSETARSWTVDAVTRDMDFQAVEVWYEQTFGGSPSFLPMFRAKGESQAVFGGWKKSEALLPTDGRLVQTFAQDGSGVRIAAPGGVPVNAVYSGRVLQVANEDDGKATVLVQHAGRIVTIYGNLEKPAVQPNDWVEAGQKLGVIPAPLDKGGESLLYFAVKQNGKTVDPAEVVPFD